MEEKNKNTEESRALTQVEQDKQAFALVQRKALVYASSTIVPDTYQGEKNLGNIIIALDMAKRMDANPLMVMQNLYVVYGRPSWSSTFLIATINSCGRFSPLRYEFKGNEGADDWGCRCYAYERTDTEKKEPLYGAWITLAMAKQEGWATKSGSKWKTMPQQMLQYRAAAFWQRVYAPEIGMGLMTAEESMDIGKRVVEDADAEEVNPAAIFAETKKDEEAKVDTETGELFPNM